MIVQRNLEAPSWRARNLCSLKRKAHSISPHRDVSSRKSLKMIPGSFYMPKDNKLKPKGDDAHFICPELQTFGLADGVGGWAKRGIDAGAYARELMRNSIVTISNEKKVHHINPKKVLSEAYSRTKAEGSSTACIITLKDQSLHAANVGDSGFMVIRNKKSIYRSPKQQRGFNCPFQLGNYTKCDRPSSAEVLEVPMEEGDVIVAGTDGLFDNMFEAEIEEAVEKGIKDGDVAEKIALNLADLALYNSYLKCGPTPFSVEAHCCGREHHGGKIDDITVVVAFITNDPTK